MVLNTILVVNLAIGMSLETFAEQMVATWLFPLTVKLTPKSIRL